MRKRLMKMLLAAVPVLLLAGTVSADEKTVTGSLASEVTTKGTNLNGTRESADSEWSKVTVPEGFVIVEKKTKVHELSAAGSEHDCEVKYEDYVEVIAGTGITQPRTILVKTHARSPKNEHGARGWMKVKVEYEAVRYK